MDFSFKNIHLGIGEENKIGYVGSFNITGRDEIKYRLPSSEIRSLGQSIYSGTLTFDISEKTRLALDTFLLNIENWRKN